MTAADNQLTLRRFRLYSILAASIASAAIAVCFFADAPRLVPAVKLALFLPLGLAFLLIWRRRPHAPGRAETLKAAARYVIITLFVLRLVALIWVIIRQ